MPACAKARRWRSGGKQVRNASGGFYIEPTIFDCSSQDFSIVREEIFGPVLVAMPFDNEQDLIAQANDSVYALAAGIWTRDYKKAWRFGACGASRQCLDQHLQAILDFDTVRRLA